MSKTLLVGGEHYQQEGATVKVSSALSSNSHCWQLSSETRNWQYETQLPKNMHIRWQSFAATSWGFIVLGGKTSSTKSFRSRNPIKSKKCYHYSFANKQWKSLPDLTEARGAAAVMSLGSKVYTIGGLNNDGQPLDLCESLDIHIGKSWKKHAPLTPGMSFPLSTICQGQIWVLFNTCNLDQKKKPAQYEISLHALNLLENRWRRMSSFPKRKDTNGTVISAYQDALYVAGGVSRCLARYDIRDNVWQLLNSPSLVRQYPSMIINGGYIFLLGGHMYKEGNKYK